MIIFLYGEDTFRSRQKLKEMKEKFLREVDPSGNSLVVVDGETANMEKINEAVAPSSLFARKRMIIIENLFANKGQTIFDQALLYFKEKTDKKEVADDNIIVFWDPIAGGEKLTKTKGDLFKLLKKQKFAAEFKLLSNTEVIVWAKKEIEKRGVKVSREAVTTMASLLGSDLWLINSEIEKLINYKSSQKFELGGDGEGVVIENNDVLHQVRGQFDENIFALTDAISAKNKALAMKLFEEQLEAGLTDAYLLNMITRQFKVLLQIRQALDSGLTQRKIINLLKLHPFVVQKGINQSRNFSLDPLKNIFKRLIEIDYLMKTGQGDAKTLLSLLIAKI